MSKSLSEKVRSLIQTLRQFRFVDGTDPFHLIAGMIDWILQLGTRGPYAKQAIRDRLIEHKEDIARYGDDMSEARRDARAGSHDWACWLD